MKKSNLITGILYVLFGVACLIVALLIETKLEDILWGFAGAGIFPGIMMICKYFYWSSPKNKERYEERLENERIEQHDELKTKIRDRAGRYTYSLGLLVVCFSILVFGILGALEVIDNARMIVLYLSGYLLFQVIAGIVIFNKLMKKYQGKIPLGTKGRTSILSYREYVRPAELHSRSAEENCSTEHVSSLRSVKVATPPCAAKAAIPCGLAVRKRF